MPEDNRITKKFPLRQWFSDSSAALSLGPVTLVLKELFPVGTGPHTGILTKPLASKMAQDLMKKHLGNERAAQLVASTEVLKRSKEAAAQQLADCARAALAAHRQNRAKKQKLSLTWASRCGMVRRLWVIIA